MSEDRYQEIMRRIHARQTQTQQQQAHHILDLLNVAGVLSTLKRSIPSAYHVGGVATHAIPDGATTLIWLYRSAFQQHQMVWLVGVWFKQPTQLYIGYKFLTYTPLIFNAEAYYQIMPKDYHPYYRDDHHPPATAQAMQFVAQDRLALRQQVETVLRSSVQDLLSSLSPS
ncbi:MAG: hypothetical protein ACOYLB_04670 [Phototrophicaceae bacterium]